MSYPASPRRICYPRRRKGVRITPETRLITRPRRWANPFEVVWPRRRGPLVWRVIWLGRGERWHDARPPWHPQLKDMDQYLDWEPAHLAAVEFYRRWIRENAPSDLIPMMRETLRDKYLACTCLYGMPCHGEVILRAIDQSVMAP